MFSIPVFATLIKLVDFHFGKGFSTNKVWAALYWANMKHFGNMLILAISFLT
jgi:hypothetical protein